MELAKRFVHWATELDRLGSGTGSTAQMTKCKNVHRGSCRLWCDSESGKTQ